MFIGTGNVDGYARVNHACFYMDDFDIERVQDVLEDHRITPHETDGAGPMRHWMSMRMPHRGEAPEGTRELST